MLKVLVTQIRKSLRMSRGFLETNIITFTEDELVEDGTGHIKYLHVIVESEGRIIAGIDR